MALLWSRTREGRRYELRRAGGTVRLYTDGVCHSQHHPRRLFTGRVWDLLALPAFLIDPPPRRALVLGVGGGSVLLILRRLFPSMALVGVEQDPVHLEVGRRHFGLRGSGLRLHRAEARAWVARHLAASEGLPFDLVVEDLCGGRGVPERAVPASDAAWLGRLLSLLRPGGALVLNCLSREELASCACLRDGRLRRRLAAALRLQAPYEENAVGAFLRKGGPPVPDPGALLRRRLRQAGLDPARRATGLRLATRRLL